MSVVPSGSPPETRKTTLNMLKVQIAPRVTAGPSIGRMIGNVTRRIRCHRLEHVLRYARERAHGHDHHEGEAEPDVGGRVGGEGRREAGEPGDRLEVGPEELVGPQDQTGDRPELAMEHALPGEGGDVARDGPRQDQEGSIDG